MNIELTPPQQKIFDFASKHDGQVDAAFFKRFGLDVRAANNLVRSGLMTLTNGVYRIKGFKKTKVEQAEEKPAKASKLAARMKDAISEEREEEPEADEDEEEREPEEERNELVDEDDDDSGPFGDDEDDSGPFDHEDDTREDDEDEEAAPASEEPTSEQPASEPAKPAKEKKEKKPRAKKVEEPAAAGECLCGCGTKLAGKRRFSQGHDAKLHSLVLRVHRGQASKEELPTLPATFEYLRSAPWMKPEIAASIGLYGEA
jgi:hypothetical protein